MVVTLNATFESSNTFEEVTITLTMTDKFEERDGEGEGYALYEILHSSLPWPTWEALKRKMREGKDECHDN